MLEDESEKLRVEILKLKEKHADSSTDWKIEKAILDRENNTFKEALDKRDAQILELRNEGVKLQEENTRLKEDLKSKDAEILELRNNVSSLMIDENTDTQNAEIVLKEMTFLEGEKKRLQTEAEKYKSMVEGVGYNLGGRLTLYTGLYTYASPKPNSTCIEWEAFQGLLFLCLLDVLFYSGMSIKSVVNMLYRQKKMQQEDDKLQLEAALLRRRVMSTTSKRFIDRLNSGFPTNFHRSETFKDMLEKPMEYQRWWHILFSLVPFLIFVGITVWNHYKGSNNCKEKVSIQTNVTNTVLDNVLLNDVFSGNRKIKLQTRLGSKFSNQPAKHNEL